MLLLQNTKEPEVEGGPENVVDVMFADDDVDDDGKENEDCSRVRGFEGWYLYLKRSRSRRKEKASPLDLGQWLLLLVRSSFH